MIRKGKNLKREKVMKDYCNSNSDNDGGGDGDHHRLKKIGNNS
jgi:hypothetical protein